MASTARKAILDAGKNLSSSFTGALGKRSKVASVGQTPVKPRITVSPASTTTITTTMTPTTSTTPTSSTVTTLPSMLSQSLSPLPTTPTLGGPQKLNFFQSRVTKKSKLQSSTSLAAFTPRKVSRFYLLPPHNGTPPSPPVSPRLHARSLAMHGNQLKGRHRGMPPPPGSAVTLPDFFI